MPSRRARWRSSPTRPGGGRRSGLGVAGAGRRGRPARRARPARRRPCTGEPSRRLSVLGVTGTAGKTSVVYLLEAGLRAAGVPAGMIGTVETRLDDVAVPAPAPRRRPPTCTRCSPWRSSAVSGRSRWRSPATRSSSAGSAACGSRWAGSPTSASTTSTSTPASRTTSQSKARLFDGRSAIEVLNLDDPAQAPLVRTDDRDLLGSRRPGRHLACRRRDRGRVRAAVHRARPGRP